MAATAWKFPATFPNGTGLTNENNILATDTTYATVTSSSAVITCSGFSFGVPAGSTVLGIEARLKGYQGAGDNCSYENSEIFDDGYGDISLGSLTNNYAIFPSTNDYMTLGGATDIGDTGGLTVAQVNSADFGFWFPIYENGANTVSIDSLEVRIHYSGATGAVTGTATSSITEADIVTGGKTIILTLTDDTWVADGATFNAQRQNIIDGIDSAQSEANGWDAVVKAGEAVASVVRTSDTVVTITLSAFATYNITATETITVTVPATALTGAAQLVATPTFTVSAVSSSTVRHLGLLGVGV